MRRALVTGGAGFIGSHLTEVLLAKGWYVYVLDDLSTGSLENLPKDNSNLDFFFGQVQDYRDVERYSDKVDVIFHLAAVVGADLVTENPIETIHTNIKATETILEFATQKPIPVLITSTSEVYGKLDKFQFSETDDLVLGPSSKSRWCYAASKIVDEHLAIAYDAIVVRLFNTIGLRQSGYYGMVVPRFVQQARLGEPLVIYGDGTQKRSFTWIGDVVDAMIKLIELPLGGQIFNIGHTQEISINELADLIIKMTKSKSEVIYAKKAFEGMYRRLPDLSKIEQTINYKPTLSLSEMLERIIDYENILSTQ